MTRRTIDFDRPKQQERSAALLRYITEQIEVQGCTPTYREMAQAIDVSKGIIWEHIEYLELRGAVVVTRTKSGNYRPNSIKLNKRVVYFAPDEWMEIQTAWGSDGDIKDGILHAAEQTRFVVTA